MPDSTPQHGPDESPEVENAVLGTPTGPSASDEVRSGPMTELVEVAPNVVAVLGALPAELELVLEPLDTGLLSDLDHQQISTALATVGNVATLGGNLAQAAPGVQGLYRMADESQNLLRAGGRLAMKDGQNLGTIIPLRGSGNTLAQARFTPVNGLNVAQFAASAGPALAMLALQSQLNEVGSLVQKNIELTNQVIQNTRREERARLDSLVTTVDQALQDARAAGAVPSSLWDTVATKGSYLRAERAKYRANVEEHVVRVRDHNPRSRREYMQGNSESIVFDAFALLSSLKAWIGYQGLSAAVARQAGQMDPVEARHFDSIVETTRRDWEMDLGAITELVGTLARELRIIVELRGPSTMKFSAKRKDVDTARQLASAVLQAISPLADSLAPVRGPLDGPDALCAPESTETRPYLDLLRWLLDSDETSGCWGSGTTAPP